MTNSQELELFEGLLGTAISREHAILPQVIELSYLVVPGDWLRLAGLARGVNILAEDFHTELSAIAVRHGVVSLGEPLLPACPVCGGSWCKGTSFDGLAHTSWDNFVKRNKDDMENH